MKDFKLQFILMKVIFDYRHTHTQNETASRGQLVGPGKLDEKNADQRPGVGPRREEPPGEAGRRSDDRRGRRSSFPQEKSVQRCPTDPGGFEN